LPKTVAGRDDFHNRTERERPHPLLPQPFHRLQQVQCVLGDFEFRLPTEAEWEYACRAGTTSAFNDGSDCTQPEGKDPALGRLGWHGEGSDGKTHAVGEKTPNAWGLYDMHGNVWEWCADYWADRYTPEAQTNPTGAKEGAWRVVRGGSCWNLSRWCRSAYRGRDVPGIRIGYQGFHLAAGQPVGSGAQKNERIVSVLTFARLQLPQKRRTPDGGHAAWTTRAAAE
jgi:formylglycine-generating enzyme required for sulfatase activity